MKKILISLFLILSMVTLGAPSKLDTQKIIKNGYNVIMDQDTEYVANKKISDREGLSFMVIYNEDPSATPENFSSYVKESAPIQNRWLAKIENNKAYIDKFITTLTNAEYNTYSIVPKKLKEKGYYTSILYTTYNELTDAEVNKKVDSLIKEVESYIK